MALAAVLALTFLALYLVFRGVDLEELRHAVARQNGWLLVVAAVCFLLQIGFGAMRWRAVLVALLPGHPAVSAVRTFSAFYAGAFANCFPLGTLGGGVARVLIARSFDAPLGHTILSVMVDQALALLAPIVLAVLTLPTIDHPLARIVWIAAVAALAAVAVFLYLLRFVERLLGRWRHRRPIHLVLLTAEELQKLIRHRNALGAIAYALLSGLCVALGAYVIGLSLGVNIGFAQMVGVISMITLVIVLPISFAGWGIREASVVAVLGLFGVAHETALALSLEMGLLAVLVSLPGGIVWLAARSAARAAAPVAS